MGGEKNDKALPNMGVAVDARAPAYGGAGRGLLIHHLWLGLGHVNWCPRALVPALGWVEEL